MSIKVITNQPLYCSGIKTLTKFRVAVLLVALPDLVLQPVQLLPLPPNPYLDVEQFEIILYVLSREMTWHLFD